MRNLKRQGANRTTPSTKSVLAIAAWIAEHRVAGTTCVVTCSALKRAYRDRLRGTRPNVRLIYLDADRQTIGARLAVRRGHFFPARLLDSQFADLEPPTADEHPHRVPVTVDSEPARIVEDLVAAQVDAD